SSRPTISALWSAEATVQAVECAARKWKIGPSNESKPHDPRKVPLSSAGSLSRLANTACASSPDFLSPAGSRTKPPRAASGLTGSSREPPDLLATRKSQSWPSAVEYTSGAACEGRVSEGLVAQ